jgi:RHS repeat-associated protein
MTVNYAQFQDAFGGDWASRLRLVSLPACALTTPAAAACRTQKSVISTNNAQAHTVTADVTVPGAASTSTTPLVLALDSTPAGPAGDFSQTSLKPTGSWTAGGSADAFTWSYPISVPSVPGGLTPQISLSYDSQSVDGLTSSTNTQPSWIGDGWDYNPGYIERSYQTCHENPIGDTKTWDNCWSDKNTLTLSLNGQTSTLVPDATTGLYHSQDDDNERIQYLGSPAAPGAPSTERFVVTTTDGTQYYFGLNKLPGWVSPNPVTNSALSEPVYSTVSGQPCYQAKFQDSHCEQPYRWNLDYVKDTHSDIVSYFYAKDTNFYGADLGSTTTTSAEYDRDTRLTSIQYGQRDGAVYTSSPAAKIVFNSVGRCDTGCDITSLSKATASDWPDVPYDLNCASATGCTAQSPSFWSEYMLQSIQTFALQGSSELPVDQWKLDHTFPSVTEIDPNTKPALWLSGITRTGQDASGNGSTTPLALPEVTFSGTPLHNRVTNSDGNPWVTRERLTDIITETGESITVGYTAPACGAGVPSDPSQNTMLCYPDYWTPPDQANPVRDWFNKYRVSTVTEDDPTDGGDTDTIVTNYTPVGQPAWHYNDNPTTLDTQRTWDQYRGYTGMIVTVGQAPDPITKTEYSYFRGMNGDTLPDSGTRTATVTDQHGDPPATDANQFAGVAYDTVVYNGDAIVTDTVSDPWTSAATGTRALSGLPPAQSFHTGTADTKVYTPLATGSTRTTETDYTHDTYGRVTATNDQADLATATDDQCATTTYDDNTTAWILDAPAETKTVSVKCATPAVLPRDAVSDELTYYDKATDTTTAPTVGDVTKSQQLISYAPDGTANYATTSTTVDEYGRPLSTTNADTFTTTTAYTPATLAEPTSVLVTDPMGHTTTTTYDPLRDLELSNKDSASYVTSGQYDTLGRLTAVFKPGIDVAATTYSYTVSNGGPSVVDTNTLEDNGSYRVSETLYDSMLRARETQLQAQAVMTDGSVVAGRDITDTVYNREGSISETTDPYFADGAVSSTYVKAQPGQTPSKTDYTYDGDGRNTVTTAIALGDVHTWQTTLSYGGNSVTTVPPAGGVPTTAITDARGNTSDMYQYHAGVPVDPIHDPTADYSDTHYTYTPAGDQATVVDAAGNTWSYQYDLLGNQLQAQDPDTGTTDNTYDAMGQLLTTTDARGKQTTTDYDNDGRATAAYDTTGGAPKSTATQIAGWAFDTPKVGYPTSTTSISGSDKYTHTINGYNNMALPTSVTDKLTGESATLIPTAGLVTAYGYNLTGSLHNQQDSPADGLPAENMVYGYDQFGEPISVGSTGASGWNYVKTLRYSELGQPVQYTLGGSPTVAIKMAYDQQTQALNDIQTTGSLVSPVIDDTQYSYANSTVSKGAGLVVSTTDNQNSATTTDTQCYAYDYAQRLNSAWTATDQCSATPTSTNSSMVGGPSPYWQSWTYDAAGDRSTQTGHDPTGTTTNDTLTSYTYPAPASATDQPHTLSSTTTTGPAAAASTASYTYDASGNTTTMTGGSTGNQTLTWTDQNKLATDTTTAGTSNYVYDASGNLLVRHDPGETTLFLGDVQLVLNTATNTATGTRFITLGGTTIAARHGSSSIDYLIPDRQGTDQLAVDAVTETVTRRQYLPFGQARGTTPTIWPGSDVGYVGGTPDTATSLENLGAREYDPASGRFLSADPVLEVTDPTQMGGYDYSGNDPITGSDPTGQMMSICVDKCGDYASPTNPDGNPRPPGPGDGHPGNSGGGRGGDGGGASGGGGSWFGQYINNIAKTPTVHRPRAPLPLPPAYTALSFTPRVTSPAVPKKKHSGLSIGLVLDNVGALGVSLGAAALEEVPGVDVLADGAAAEFDETVLGEDSEAFASEADESASDDTEDACTNSFAASTPVLLANHTSVPIDHIKIGDVIANAAPNAPTGTPDQKHVVTATHVTYTDHDYTDVTVATSHGPSTVTGTAHHLYWDATTDHWTQADQLRTGDRLQTSNGLTVAIVGLHNYTTTLVTYNLTIDNLHTYYVLAGTTAILVHNCNSARFTVDSNGVTTDTVHGDPDIMDRNPLDGTKYTAKVLQQATTGDYHAFSELADTFPTMRNATIEHGGDGIPRMHVRMPVEYDGKAGFFHWIVEQNGTINHRLFTPSG